jgi:exodeoxyribonuclease V alpha subunit
MAPTGKASKRMQETTKYYASTIHRQLGYNFEEGFFYNEEQYLPASLIIIDEFSMVDIYLAWYLFRAIHLNCKVVIVGDTDQLPSVGPGEVLNDLIESGIINTIKLTEIHRQAQDSNIIKLSYECKNGKITKNCFNTSDDVLFYKTDSGSVKDIVLKYIDKIIDSGYDLYNDVQVLAPMYKGEAGIDILNYEIQKKFNNKEGEILFQNKSYKVGDKVIQTKNDKDKNVMNGEIGTIIDFYYDSNEKASLIIDFDGIHVKYNKDDLENLTHAYAISVHKSQGSEYPIVILPIVKSYSFMLRRKLIYTAITRAKKKLIIIGDLYYLQLGINYFDEKRQTSLKNRLVENKKTSIKEMYGLCFDVEEIDDDITPYNFM